MPEETEVQEEPKPAKGGSAIGKMLLIVIIALVSSAGGSVISFVLLSKTMGAGAHAGGEEKNGQEETEAEKMVELLEKSAVLPLEPFVVNLADADAARYLRIKVSLMVDDKSKLPELAENQALQLKVRDLIIQSLTAKTSQDLINEDGKNKLRHEIQERVAVYFREPKLVDVMFTEFVIQL